MLRPLTFTTCVSLCLFLAGCTASTETAPSAEQDELSQWVSENPAPDSPELEE